MNPHQFLDLEVPLTMKTFLLQVTAEVEVEEEEVAEEEVLLNRIQELDKVLENKIQNKLWRKPKMNSQLYEHCECSFSIKSKDMADKQR